MSYGRGESHDVRERRPPPEAVYTTLDVTSPERSDD
jgi:hypothetical protein